MGINGEVDTNNFTSCYIDYLNSTVEHNNEIENIVIWSDGCAAQNKCNILSSAELTLVVQNNITLLHKYLEVGHTVHSTVERATKMSKINLPTDYINVIQLARKKGTPYGVKYLNYSLFKDYKPVADNKTVKPSKQVGPPYVSNIRQFRYNPDGIIYVNLTYDEDTWFPLPHEINQRFLTHPTLYESPIKISYSKWTDLQEIKQTIPKECHHFYDQLDHHPNPKASHPVLIPL